MKTDNQYHRIFSDVQGLSKQLRDFQKLFGELVSSVTEINKMVGVVRDISGKTDLLALNASIEAARAGHAGKGFAIVAHEVARLAEKAQESIFNVEKASDHVEDKIQLLSERLEQTFQNINEIENEINEHICKIESENSERAA